MNFVIKTYPTNIGYVNQILDSCCNILKSTALTNNDNASMKLLVKLLSIPLESLSIAVLRMHHYPTLMDYMKFTNKRTVALRICKAVIKDNKKLVSGRTIDQLIDFIKPLLVDDDQGQKEDPFEFEDGQESVSRILHMIYHPANNDIYFDLVMKFKRVFSKGGPQRQKFTYPALFFTFIKLSAAITHREIHGVQPYEEEKKDDDDDEQEVAPTVKVD